MDRMKRFNFTRENCGVVPDSDAHKVGNTNNIKPTIVIFNNNRKSGESFFLTQNL